MTCISSSRNRPSLRPVLKNLVFCLLAPAVAAHFRRCLSSLKPFDEVSALDFACRWRFWRESITPAQVRVEFASLLELVKSRQPRIILEIGTYNGGSLFCFTRVARDDAHIISIDLPGGLYGRGYPPWRKRLYRAFPLLGQKLTLLRVDSHASETVEKIRSLLQGRKIDFLFIDGDHSYEGVRQDFLNYRDLVSDNGLIALHDIVPGTERYVDGALSVGGVPKFWRELATQRATVEFVEN